MNDRRARAALIPIISKLASLAGNISLVDDARKLRHAAQLIAEVAICSSDDTIRSRPTTQDPDHG